MKTGSQEIIAGVDYGSRLAGTTALCIGNTGGEFRDILQANKKKCADEFILNCVRQYSVSAIFMDAPFSLPGVYSSLKGFDDFFYRKADKELKAMSPMFLGGLTARAMKLKTKLDEEGVKCIEVYPGGLARVLGLQEMGYKGKREFISDCFQSLKGQFDGILGPCPENWHQFDALLAYFTGIRYYREKAEVFGDKREGTILI